MVWFRKTYTTISPKAKRTDTPGGLWIKCENCGELIYKSDWEKKFKVCLQCNYHFRLTIKERLAIILDKDLFREYDAKLKPIDFLEFNDSKSYHERLEEVQNHTGLVDAIITGEGEIFGYPVAIGVLSFEFMGGSMGSVVGEKIARLFEQASIKKYPVIVISSSGGARMQEGIISLMQMAKTSAAITRFSQSGGLYISILTDPTTGGVLASFASLGDIIIAEPQALIGFAGPRVIEQTIKQRLPAGFQRAEFLLEYGLIDMIVERKDLKETLKKLLDMLGGERRKRNSIKE